jgi:hypothetical protein
MPNGEGAVPRSPTLRPESAHNDATGASAGITSTTVCDTILDLQTNGPYGLWEGSRYARGRGLVNVFAII